MPPTDPSHAGLRLILVFVVLVVAAGGHLARAGVVRPKPMRLAPPGQVVLVSSFRAIRTGVAQAFASGDYLVSTHSWGPVGNPHGRAPIVINDALGTTAPLDPSCDVDALGLPWVLMSCPLSPDPSGPYDFELYSLADGTRQTVTPSPGLPCPLSDVLAGGPLMCYADAVGSNWIEWVHGGYHVTTSFYYQNIQTGELRENPSNGTTFPDLNSPSLTEKTCPGVRLIPSFVPAPDDYANIWGRLTYEGQIALATTNSGKIFLERCGTHMRRLLANFGAYVVSNVISNVAANARVIVWQTAVNRLSGLFLPSLQKFTMRLPSAVVASEAPYGPGVGFMLSLTSDALYMNEDDGTLWRTVSPSALPRDVSGPRVTLSKSTLTCVRGRWLNAASFSYEWRVNARREKATKPRLVIGKSPERRSVNCSVSASNPTGTTTASSARLYVR